MKRERVRVVIAGGGVAALEAMMALHELAAAEVEVQLVTPTPEFVYRPLAVAEPFGLGDARRFDVIAMAADHGAAVHMAGLQAVDTAVKQIVTWDGRRLPYDVLLVAIGASSVTAVPGSVTIQGPGFTGRFRTLLGDLEDGRAERVAFVLPGGTSWPLPLYELALMTASRLAELGGSRPQLSLVTPEEAPLALFGPAASQAIRGLLEARGIELHLSRYASEFRDGRLEVVPGDGLSFDRVVSLPRLVGPRLEGLPHDVNGFIPVDLNAAVRGVQDVYAAGDATDGAIKQGGLAAQQADAAAAAIATRAGADVEPEPFTPVLRGMLLTGSTPRYMRAEVSGGKGENWRVSDDALWWPPSKIAGRRLAPYLALRQPEIEDAPFGLSVEVDVSEPGVRQRTVSAMRSESAEAR